MFGDSAQAIVTAYHTGSVSYTEAVRRLLDLGVSVTDATRRPADRPAAAATRPPTRASDYDGYRA